MDDIKFNKEVIIDPKNKDVDFIKKVNENSSNQKKLEESLEFDLLLKKSLNVPVPENLNEKIMLNTLANTNDKMHSKFSIKKSLIAAAASLSLFFIPLIPVHSSIEEQMVYELKNHPELISEDYNVSLSKFNEIASKFNFKLSNNIKDIRIVKNCSYKGKKGIHFSIDGETSPIIIHYFHGLTSNETEFTNNNIKGHIIKTKEGLFITMSDVLNDQSIIINEINNFI